MTTNQFAKIIAVCVGSYLLITAISEASSLLITAETAQFMGRSPALYLYAAMPVISALLLGFLIYRYASVLSVANIQSTEIELLAVGMKLMGFYALIKSIFYVAGFVTGIGIHVFTSAPIQWEGTVRLGLSGLAYVIIGYLMVFRTEWIIGHVTARS